MNILMITSSWPTPDRPHLMPFVVQQVKSLQAAGVNVNIFEFEGKMNPLNYLKAWIRLRKEHDLRVYDVIHAQYGQNAFPLLLSGRPTVVTFHGSELIGIVGRNGNYTFIGRILRMVCRIMAKFIKACIVVSEELRTNLPHVRRSYVIPCGVDRTMFYPIDQRNARQILGLPQSASIVLFAGNPALMVKQHDLAVSAIAKVKERCPAVTLEVLHGKAHSTVPLYMNAADVLLLTSRHEGSPMVIKEALACNLPIVSLDVGDVRERIGKIIGCKVCDDNSPDAIANEVETVLVAHRRLDCQGQIHDIGVEYVAQRIIEVYREVQAS